MGCVSGRQRHRAKAIRNFPEFDKIVLDSENVTTLLDLEEDSGLYKLETYRKFAERVKKAKKD